MRLLALVAGVCLWLAAAPAGAAPPLHRPGTAADRDVPRPRASGSIRALRAAGVDRAESARAQTAGTYKAVVILLQFTDNRADTLSHTPAAFESLLFSVESHPTGSFRDYYREVSRGQFDVEGTVTRWYTAPRPYSFYNAGADPGFGPFPGNAQGMVADAVQLADPDVDFSQYDNDGPDGVPDSGDDDGFVDGLFVVHAGPGGEEVGGAAIRSHKWNLPAAVEVDGVRVSPFTMEPEEFGLTYPGASAGDLISVGVFCHEFGHILGLPDLYDVTESSAGIGEWDLMGYGVYTHRAGEAPGSSPAHFSAWSKDRLGWVTPTWVLQDSAGVTIPPVETSGQVFRLWTNGEDGGQYFLLENRQPIGFDAGLVRSSIGSGQGPSHGLLIYHVDDSVIGNDDPARKQIDVEEAGGPGGIVGIQNLDHPYGVTQVQDVCGALANVEGNRGDTRDPRPGLAGVTSFEPGSCPSSASICEGMASQVAVRNIVESGSDIHADFFVDAITLRRLAIHVEDPPGPDVPNDGDGIVEPGETIRIRVPITNTGSVPTGPLVARLEAEVFLALDPDSILYPSLSGGATDSGSVVLATVLSAPDPRGGTITMDFHGAPGLVDRDSVQVLVGGRTGICENFETMQRKWTSVALGCNGVDDWHREAGVNSTPGGTWAWRVGPFGTIGSYAPSQDTRLVSQPIRLQGLSDTLRFQQRYDAEAPFDGLSVDISTDGGETWVLLTPVGGYNGGDRFSGFQPAFARVDVPLDGYQGLVQVGFRFRSNAVNGGLGFWIDDVLVEGTDECATTAVQVERFEAAADPGRRSVRLSWKLDGAAISVRIDRASAGDPRRNVATLAGTGREGAYEDTDVRSGITYSYWLTAEIPGEPSATAGPVRVGVTAGVGDAPPRVLAMSPIVPNPFWGTARFSVSLDRDERFMVRVFRADGSRVRTLADSPGRTQDYPFTWDGTDDRGRPVGAGIYFVELRSGTRVRIQKAVLLK
ncbi:MAG TPA: M6 family metalloprotease domain-containing protein [Candidatus Eisenbacteria bacterium]|nr:M6 family metalloprotease domain-containing protein [Candidatus Eisenbacteria bacterium]